MKRLRQHSPELQAKIAAARLTREQFIAETGIDLKALVANGFDANSGRAVQPTEQEASDEDLPR